MSEVTTARGMPVIALTAAAMIAFAANSLLCRFALAADLIDPGAFTAVRLLSGAVVLYAILRSARRADRLAGSWGGAAALFVYAAAFSYAYVSLSAGTGALLLFGAVQITMIGVGLWRGERFTAIQSLGFVIAIVGLAVLLAPGVSAPSTVGALLMLLAGSAWGAYSLLGRGVADPLASTCGNFIRAAPAALLLFLPMIAGVEHAEASGLVSAILSGALASGVGYAVWYAALAGLSSAQGASVQLSVPVITALAGTVVLGETLTTRLILTSCAVLGGVAVVIASRGRISHALSEPDQ
ncbi:DMT family transporter [Novosphingobium tardum]|uniref:DMT family transporter n=1 Tax=Novosphingobium tardum TaxID=1538021 RepID=A0ABV8RP34_9SPHN